MRYLGTILLTIIGLSGAQAQPFFLKSKGSQPQNTKIRTQGTTDFSGTWTGTCDGSAEEVILTIHQSRNALVFTFPYEDEALRFKINGATILNQSTAQQIEVDAGIANWADDGQGLYVNDLRWLERPGVFNLNYSKTLMRLSQHKLILTSDYIFRGDTVHMDEQDNFQCILSKQK